MGHGRAELKYARILTLGGRSFELWLLAVQKKTESPVFSASQVGKYALNLENDTESVAGLFQQIALPESTDRKLSANQVTHLICNWNHPCYAKMQTKPYSK